MITLDKDKIDGFVYLIQDQNGNFKIGSTKSVQGRMKQLRREVNSLKLVSVIPSRRYIYLERFLHFHFEDLRIKGEWFRDDDLVRKTAIFLEKHGELFGSYFMEFPKGK